MSAPRPAAPHPPARPLVVPSPSATIELRRTTAAEGVMVCVSGEVGHGDTAVLARLLRAELDAGPSVVVVDLRRVTRYGPSCVEMLEVTRGRARAVGVGLHVLDAERGTGR